MSDTFYTNVAIYGSRILYRGVENGIKVRQRIDYNPTLYLASKEPTQFTTVTGEYVSEIKPGNIRDSRDFCNKYNGVDNFKIYGNQKYEYAYIADHFSNDVEWNRSLINVANIDIEVGSENGFPEPETASEPITAITVRTNSKFLVYGLGPYDNARGDVRYIRCNQESDLITAFLTDWSLDYPDIITGWNVKFFDIPYLVNRITRIFSEDYVKRISPWGVVSQRTVTAMGKDRITYNLLGISCLDYLEIYKKFSPKGQSQESYKLDFICHEELGERKLSYDEYGSLHTLYKEDHQKFIEYNIRDVELVEKLDGKLKLIDLALTLAYDSKSNYDDVTSQVRMWDNIIFNHLKKQNKVISPIERHNKDSAYIGAYVKEPLIGLHKWIASFDLTSLYPSLIMQYNVSTDKIVDGVLDGISIDSMLNKQNDLSFLKEENLTVTPNGSLFKVDNQGFMPEIIETMFIDRQKYKKVMLAAQKELELIQKELERRKIQ